VKKIITIASIAALSTYSFADDSDAKIRLTLGAGGNLASKSTSDVTLNAGGAQLGSAELEFDLKPTVSLDVGFRFMPKNSFGLMAGVTYDMKREIEGGNVTIGSDSFSFSGNEKDEIITYVAYANAVYRWDSFYVPFGVNLSTYKFKDRSGDNYDIDGGLGGQAGVGFMITPNFAIEATAR
jgi:hypothetical protein